MIISPILWFVNKNISFSSIYDEETGVDTYTKITEHAYGEWTEIKPATWWEEGKQHRQCVDCTEEQTEVLPKLPININNL